MITQRRRIQSHILRHQIFNNSNKVNPDQRLSIICPLTKGYRESFNSCMCRTCLESGRVGEEDLREIFLSAISIYE